MNIVLQDCDPRRDRYTAGYMSADRYRDPVIEAYLPGVDRTLLRENLKLSFEERARKHARALAMTLELRRAGQAAKKKSP